MNKNQYINPYQKIDYSAIDTSYCFLKIILQTNNSSANSKMRIKIIGFNNSAEHESTLFLDWSYDSGTQTYSRLNFKMSVNSYQGYNFIAKRLDNELYLFMKTHVGGESMHVLVEESDNLDYIFKNEAEDTSIEWDQIITCTIPDRQQFTVASNVAVDTTYLDTSYFNKEYCHINVSLWISHEKTYNDTLITLSSAYRVSGLLIKETGEDAGKTWPLRGKSGSTKEIVTYGSSLDNVPVGTYRMILSGYITSNRPTWE